MTSESNRISGASTYYVGSVFSTWGWSWNAVDQADDDGLDGIVFMRKKEVNELKPGDKRSWKHAFTGGAISVQVKSGASYIDSQTEDQFEISISNFQAKRDIWQKSPIPVALVYVEAVSQGRVCTRGWWADLRSPTSYSSKGTIIVKRRNRFQPGLECRRPFARLADGQIKRQNLPTIDMSIKSALPGKLNAMSRGLKHAAWEFYHQWKELGATNPVIGDIIVNRTGWSHMTRVGRPVSRIETSFRLLPAAAQIVETVKEWRVLRRGRTNREFANGTWAAYEYLGLSAMIKLPSDAPFEAMVILKRETIFSETNTDSAENETIRTVMISRKTWFYSIYKPGRNKP
ncbi:DUF4365 domain-containing protein [Caballeronia cordobensis]|uniref:DUF4365 domain-containing protein n=1 Tax=Caballeronia cordobensis TaxID=1353886 RepID=UPI00045EFEC2|nr:putative membrane protein [Burkholderia sp. RPE67]